MSPIILISFCVNMLDIDFEIKNIEKSFSPFSKGHALVLNLKFHTWLYGVEFLGGLSCLNINGFFAS